LLGNEAGRAIYDGDALIAAGGAIIQRARRFSFRDFELAAAVVDLDLGDVRQAGLASYQPRVSRDASAIVPAPFTYPPAGPASARIYEAAWERSPHRKEEELTRALSLALFDYLRKSRSRGYVISLSGGADSALVSCLVAMSLRLAVTELGFDGVAD